MTGTIDVEWEIAIRKAYGPKAGSEERGERSEQPVIEVEEVSEDKAENRNQKAEITEGGNIQQPTSNIEQPMKGGKV